MTGDQLDAALAVAVRAAAEAAAIVRHYAADRSRLSLRDKGIFELVTEADVEAQRALVRVLGGVVDGAGFLGEEEGLGEGATGGLLWVLDPIDGTTNFTHGVAPFAVSVGLVLDGRAVAGVVHEVAGDEVFAGRTGGEMTVDGVPTRVSPADSLSRALVATGFPYRDFAFTDVYMETLRGFFGRTQGVRRHGAASVDLAYVAAGRFEGFFERGLSPWDVAAGLALVDAAGGRCTDFRNRQPGVFSPDVLASNGLLHDDLLGLLAPMRAE